MGGITDGEGVRANSSQGGKGGDKVMEMERSIGGKDRKTKRHCNETEINGMEAVRDKSSERDEKIKKRETD